MQADNKKYKLIFSPNVARKLLKQGNCIYDIKPDKKNINKTIFVFELTSKLENDLANL